MRLLVSTLAALSACSIYDFDALSRGATADGGADGGEDAGLPCSTRTDLQACVDFEDGVPAFVGFGDVTTERVSDVARRGGYAVRMQRVPGAAEYAARYYQRLPSRFIRLFVRLDTNLGPLQAVDLEDTQNAQGVLVTVEAGFGFRFANRRTGQTTDFPAPVVQRQWHCIELDARAGADGGVALWLDGAVVTGSATADFSMDRLQVGAGYDVTQGGTVWFDELAFSSARIGCD